MTPQEIRLEVNSRPELSSLLPNYGAIAEILSTNRTKLVPTEIGPGMIIAKLGELGQGTGGQFLDTLVAISAQDRDIYWLMEVIKQGKLRVDMQATRYGMLALKAAIPSLSAQIDKLLELGVEPDSVTTEEVKQAMEGFIVQSRIELITDQLSADQQYCVKTGGLYLPDDIVEMYKHGDETKLAAYGFPASYVAFG